MPDEFLNWDVKIFGFDCVTSMQMRENMLYVKRTRALPSVGCEADAVVPEIREDTVSTSAEDGFILFADGCFSRGPTEYSSAATWEYGLVVGRRRVRVQFPELDGRQATTVFYEEWDSEFDNGSLLPGCGSKSYRVEEGGSCGAEGILNGTWHRTGAVWTPTSPLETVEDVVERSSSFFQRTCPQGVTLRKVVDDDNTALEVGWMYEENKRVVISRQYGPDSRLRRVSKFMEERH